MDPNKTLNELRKVMAEIRRTPQSDEADEAAELFQALDDWITRGGFLPKDWNKPKFIAEQK